MLDPPGSGHTRQPEADRWVPRAGAPGPSQGSPGGLDPGCARPRRGPRALADGGVRRRGEAGPEWAGEGAHGDAKVAARLTGGDADQERRRGGSATDRGGGAANRRGGGPAGEGKGPG